MCKQLTSVLLIQRSPCTISSAGLALILDHNEQHRVQELTCSLWWPFTNMFSFWWWLVITNFMSGTNLYIWKNFFNRLSRLVNLIRNFHFNLFLMTLATQGSTISMFSNIFMVYLQLNMAKVLYRDPIHVETVPLLAGSPEQNAYYKLDHFQVLPRWGHLCSSQKSTVVCMSRSTPQRTCLDFLITQGTWKNLVFSSIFPRPICTSLN